MRLIDADVLRADVLEWENCYNGFSDTYDKARIIDAIDEQPTIKVEPVRRGRWKVWYHGEDGFSFNCSECGTPIGWRTNYCPNCGAKMGEEE